MKYIITESQLDKAIFLYLNNQDFIQIEKGTSIYFVNSEGDEYAQIKYFKTHGWCVIYLDLVKEISSFFSLKNSDSRKIISKWFENITQMKVTDIQSAGKETLGGVRIPPN